MRERVCAQMNLSGIWSLAVRVLHVLQYKVLLCVALPQTLPWLQRLVWR
ncbi:hypothetical protein RZS08_00120 [Arthrospira platensis SPKY1]|nr:hypothetical protein [Arthrospira platensis SPKY1]